MPEKQLTSPFHFLPFLLWIPSVALETTMELTSVHMYLILVNFVKFYAFFETFKSDIHLKKIS